MSFEHNVSHGKTHPFSFHMDQASAIGGHTQPLRPFTFPQRGLLRTAASLLRSGWEWIERARLAQAGARRMRVIETVSLGDKRFASILQVDGAQFLIGTSATSVQLLTRLDAKAGEADSAVATVQESV